MTVAEHICLPHMPLFGLLSRTELLAPTDIVQLKGVNLVGEDLGCASCNGIPEHDLQVIAFVQPTVCKIEPCDQHQSSCIIHREYSDIIDTRHVVSLSNIFLAVQLDMNKVAAPECLILARTARVGLKIMPVANISPEARDTVLLGDIVEVQIEESNLLRNIVYAWCDLITVCYPPFLTPRKYCHLLS